VIRNKYIVAAGFVPTTFGAAVAADVPSDKAPLAPAPVVAAAPFSWTGFYAGMNAGFLSHQGSFTGAMPAVSVWNYAWPSRSTSARGSLFGGQIGYNYQSGSMVFGIEADYGVSSARRTEEVNSGYVWRQRTGLNNFGTVRLRQGYAFDRALIYATSGLAFGSLTEAIQGINGGTPYSWSRGSSLKAGFAVGAGVEYSPINDFSIKAEGLYYDLGRQNHVSTTTSSSVGATSFAAGFVWRIGLNYRFGGNTSPVVAKY
jgi:outer membrane immunogenic protein